MALSLCPLSHQCDGTGGRPSVNAVNMQFTINCFRQLFPDNAHIFSKITDISQTAVKFPDISRFSRQVVWCNSGWCQPVRQEFMENECEALPGVAYPGVRDNRSTINTKTGYDDDMMVTLYISSSK